jgi:pimeloyl-ACP methyl ester carboxylesterase
MVLHGADDGCIGAELTHGIRRAFSDALALHVLPNAGHFVHLEQPDRVNELTLGFFESGG